MRFSLSSISDILTFGVKGMVHSTKLGSALRKISFTKVLLVYFDDVNYLSHVEI